MSEVDDMKKAIAEQKVQRDEATKRVKIAIDSVDRTRKVKRDESNRPG